MRVISLVPAATEMVYALGAVDQLVAVTHDDDFPPAVRSLPRVTRSTIPVHASAREIDTLVREAGAHGESTFHLDEHALRDARPDLILGQTLCAVCAVTLDQIPAALEHAPEVVPLDAASLEGMFEDLRRVGVALRREREAERLIAELRRRMQAVADRVTGLRRPRVACLEWLDPPFNAGHWVPEQVRIARPEIVIAMPCGWDAERAAREAEAMTLVSDARAVGVDGAAYFSRPGPRLVDGIELLASILHPGQVAAPEGALAIAVSA